MILLTCQTDVLTKLGAVCLRLHERVAMGHARAKTVIIYDFVPRN